MIRPLTTIKKEMRTLGLDGCNPKRIIGVVVRGGYFLDGVVLFENISKKSLGIQIVNIPYHPELRCIMVHDQTNRLKTSSIERQTGLPLIKVSNDYNGSRKETIVSVSKRGHLSVKTKLPTSILEKILALTWTTGPLPEPVRVAHLLARAQVFHKPFQDKQ